MNPTELNTYIRAYAKSNPTLTPEQMAEGLIDGLQQLRNQDMIRAAERDVERIARRNSGLTGARA